MSEYVSAVEAARVSGLSERTVRRWVKRGKLRAVRDGHAVRVPLSEVLALCSRPSCRPADTGQVGHVDNGQARLRHDGEQATSQDNSQDSLLALVRDLQAELLRRSEAAAMWQARAEMLGHQLRALEAPTARHQTPTASILTAEGSDPPLEPSEPPSVLSPVPQPIPPEPNGGSPWWRRWWAALSVP